MKTVSISDGVAVAIVLASGGALLARAAGIWIPAGSTAGLVFSVCASAYVVWLLLRSRRTDGRVIAVSVWIMVVVLMYPAGVSTALKLVVMLILLWLLRSLYFHTTMSIVLADLMLVVAGTLLMLWAYSQTGSLLVALWCFFLLQAFFALLLKPDRTHACAPGEDEYRQRDFQRAHSAAVGAIRKLSTDS